MTADQPDLIAYLSTRRDEESAAARAALSGQCDPENGWGVEPSAAGRGWTVVPHVGLIHEEVQARHVEAWNPARVLAEVAAKRAIIGLHAHYPSHDAGICAHDEGDPGFGCQVCHRRDELIQSRGWCETLLALAQPYADRVDFHDQWRAR